MRLIRDRFLCLGVRLWVIGNGRSSFDIRVAVSASSPGLTVNDLAASSSWHARVVRAQVNFIEALELNVKINYSS